MKFQAAYFYEFGLQQWIRLWVGGLPVGEDARAAAVSVDSINM